MQRLNPFRHKKVCHLTSVHPRYDIRIFVKQARTLVKAGYNTSLIVADSLGDEEKDGVKIFDVGKNLSGRIGRFVRTAMSVYKRAIRVDADLYHFHDPELIIAGLLLRFKKKKVIYDVHEDLPRQVMGKYYLPRYFRKTIAFGVEIIETIASPFFSAIFTATPHIRERFKKNNINTVDINNYPILEELDNPEIHWEDRFDKICYLGSIAENRGAMELLDALEDLSCELDLAGRFSPYSVRERACNKPGWAKVNELGFVNRDGVRSILDSCRIGMVTLHPIANYLDSLPIKMFEYMAAGIPVIASNFPLWEKIIRENNCGICVDPQNAKDIADAVTLLLNDKKLASVMGRNGKKAVEAKYNWGFEGKKLLNLYKRLL